MMVQRLLRIILATALATLPLVGCGGDDGDEEPTIVMTDNVYTPDNLQIEVGDVVTFVNRGKQGTHSANAEYGVDIDPSPGSGATDHSGKDVNHAWRKGFATHALFPDEEQRVVFHVARRYDYFCSFHTEMRGTIEVVPKDG
jgi:plastocyanin